MTILLSMLAVRPRLITRISLPCLSCRYIPSKKPTPQVPFTQCRGITELTYLRYFSPESFPIGSTQQLLSAVHDWTGLPWWATIALSTVALRSLITLPLMAYTIRNAARVELLQPEIKALAAELNGEVARAKVMYKWSKQRAGQHFKINMKRLVQNLYVRDNCHPLKETILPCIQIPIWICVSMALRSMAGALAVTGVDAPVLCPSMASEGVMWFSNLLLPDSTLILPFAFCVTNLLIIEMHKLRAGTPTRFQRYFTYSLQGTAILMLPIAASVPSCMSFYWTVSSLFGLVQNLVLKFPSVRRAVGIPRTPSESSTPFRDMLTVAKQKYTRSNVKD